jgi:guanine deaminase
MNHHQSQTVFLRRAIELAVQNASAGQLPFGALVVRDGDILATGVNTELSEHDPTAMPKSAPCGGPVETSAR